MGKEGTRRRPLEPAASERVTVGSARGLKRKAGTGIGSTRTSVEKGSTKRGK